MSINSNDSEIQQPLCYEIYTFTKGSSIIRLTSYNQDMTIGGELYRAVPIKRSELKYCLGSVNVPCEIVIPVDYIYTLVSGTAPASPITVAIKRYYLGDNTNYHSIFNGIITGWMQSGREVVIKCLNRGYELKTELPRKYYQALCDHQLFDAGCALDKEDYKMRIKISRYDAIAGSTFLSVTNFSPDSFGNNYSDKILAVFGGYFTQGYIEYGENRYLVAKHYVDLLDPKLETQYQIPFPSGATNLIVTIYPGCSKVPHQCLDDFSNLAKFSGFWYMPANNPTEKGLNI